MGAYSAGYGLGSAYKRNPAPAPAGFPRATNQATISRYNPPNPGPPTAVTDTYGAVIAADGPVGWWRLDGNTDDHTGGASGTLTNGATHATALTTSYTGAQSVDFDGTNDYVVIPAQPKLELFDNLTLEAWFSPDTLAAGFHDIANRIYWGIQHNGTQVGVWWTGFSASYAPGVTLVAGQTYHAVATFSGGTAHLWLNGVDVQTLTYTPSGGGAQPLRIGAWDGGSEFFDGRIDEVAVYDRVLTSTEIGEHYTAGGGSPVPVTGAGALTGTAATLSGAGTSTITATGALAATPATLAGTGLVKAVGSGALTATAATVSGAGALHITGPGTLTATPAALSGPGTLTLTGSGGLTSTPTTLAGSGTTTVAGTGGLAATPATLAGGGTVIEPAPDVVTGAGILAGGTPGLAGTGTVTVAAAGALVAASPSLGGLGTLRLVGAATLTAQAASLIGSGLVVDPGQFRDITLTVGPGRSRSLAASGSSRGLTAIGTGARSLTAAGASRQLVAAGSSRTLTARPRE